MAFYLLHNYMDFIAIYGILGYLAVVLVIRIIQYLFFGSMIIFANGVSRFLFWCILILGLYFWYRRYRRKKEKAKWAEILDWKKKSFPEINPFQFHNILRNSLNHDLIRYVDDIPYNRAFFFSAGSSTNFDLDFNIPIFFHAQTDGKDGLFQEYGFLVTSTEVIVKKPITIRDENSKNIKDVKAEYLPFANIYKTDLILESSRGKLYVFYADGTKRMISIAPAEAEFLQAVFDIAIEVGWTHQVEQIIASSIPNEVDIEQVAFSTEEISEAWEKSEAVFNKENDIQEKNNQVKNIGAFANFNPIQTELGQNQINDRFGSGQGHGHVGEQAGDVFDKLQLRDAQKLGASHEKHGADRVVNNENIQTKFGRTSGKTIGQFFDNGVAIYKNPDGSMMTLEVPKDQYDDVVKLMAKRIKDGQVPNESNPANAAKYVKKSPLTYEQAQIATKSIFDRNSTIKVRDEYGNIVTKNVTFAEKLFYSAGLDFLTGATASMPVGLVSGVWVYCNTRSQGKEPQDALKLAMIATAKPVLIGGTMYMLSSQFAGSAIGKKTGESFAKNILGKTLTNNQRTSMVTKGSMGLMTAAIVVGPDLVDCLRGRISVEQLIKNAVVSGGGMVAGAMAGAALGSVVPGVGTAIGTVVGGAMGATATKAIADEFKVDDSVMMMQIAKEEFIETVMVTPLSQEEFEQILEKTFIHKQFASKLKDMFASGEPKEYIHKEFLDLVTEEFSKRELPDESEIVEMMMVQKELFGLAS